MAKYLIPYLSSETNTPDVWRYNLNGQFTPMQKAFLKPLTARELVKAQTAALKTPDADKALLPDGNGTAQTRKSATLSTALAVCGLLLVFGDILGISLERILLLAISLLGLGLSIALFARQKHTKRQQAKHRTSFVVSTLGDDASLQSEKSRFVQRVASSTGPLEFTMQGATPIIRLNDLSFEIMGELWWKLRDAKGPFGVFYTMLDGETKVLLSIAPLDAVTPLTEAKLDSVVGIGDDGELVYADEASRITRSLAE